MSEPIIIADGYSAEPYGDGYIISHRDGGRRTAEHDMASAVREIASLRAALAAQVPQPLADAQLSAGLRHAIDIPTASEGAAFRKGARWAWRLRAAPGASPPPAALALVPVEPTEAMQFAGHGPVDRPVGRLVEHRTDCLPQITHVAIRYAGRVWSLPAPNRHHNVIRHIASETGDGIRGPDVQGFLDDTGLFLRRAQAYSLAARNGQLKRRPGGYQGTDLYSEDLW